LIVFCGCGDQQKLVEVVFDANYFPFSFVEGPSGNLSIRSNLEDLVVGSSCPETGRVAINAVVIRVALGVLAAAPDPAAVSSGTVIETVGNAACAFIVVVAGILGECQGKTKGHEHVYPRHLFYLFNSQ